MNSFLLTRGSLHSWTWLFLWGENHILLFNDWKERSNSGNHDEVECGWRSNVRMTGNLTNRFTYSESKWRLWDGLSIAIRIDHKILANWNIAFWWELSIVAFNLASMKICTQQWEMTELNATIFTLKFEIGIFLAFKALKSGYPGYIVVTFQNRTKMAYLAPS